MSQTWGFVFIKKRLSMKGSSKSQMARMHRKLLKEEGSLVFARLADQLRLSDHVEDAIDLLQKGLEFHPGYTSGHVVLGNCYLDLGALEDARETFLRALALDSENILVLKSLGDILHRQGDVEEALGCYRKALELDPRNAGVREVVQRLSAQRPEEPPPADPEQTMPLATGTPYFQEKALEPKESLASLLNEESPAQTAVEPPRLSPEEEELLQEHGELGTGKGPPRGMATATLGEIYFQQGLLEKAIETYKKVLRHKPEDQVVRDRLQELRALRSSKNRRRKASPDDTTQASLPSHSEQGDPSSAEDIEEVT
jgi:tetratricopeptide (TPR) repeat protein